MKPWIWSSLTSSGAEEHWAIIDLKGKAGHTRTIPMPGWVKCLLDKLAPGCEPDLRKAVPSSEQKREAVG